MTTPNTAISMPQVRKRFCQTSLMSFSTAALTTALSNDSEISRIDNTRTIHRTESMPLNVP